jgi:hypothetical protein
MRLLKFKKGKKYFIKFHKYYHFLSNNPRDRCFFNFDDSVYSAQLLSGKNISTVDQYHNDNELSGKDKEVM